MDNQEPKFKLNETVYIVDTTRIYKGVVVEIEIKRNDFGTTISYEIVTGQRVGYKDHTAVVTNLCRRNEDDVYKTNTVLSDISSDVDSDEITKNRKKKYG